MRKIFFRGKRKDTGDWVYEDLKHLDNGNIHIFGNRYSQPVEEKTIGQFTGLYDKFGTAIYEGDIVEYRTKKYVVKFQNGMFYASVHEFQPETFEGFPLHALTTNAETGEECEVIGIIHDNPIEE